MGEKRKKQSHMQQPKERLLQASCEKKIELDTGKAYDSVGRALAQTLSAGKLTHDDLFAQLESSDFLAEQQVDTDERKEVVNWFIERGLVKEKLGKEGDRWYSIKSDKARKALLGGGLVRAMVLANHVAEIDGSAEAVSIDDIYARHDENRRVKQIDIKASKDNCSVLPINELRIGHQDSRAGHQLVREHIDRLAAVPHEQRPDVILVSNLIQGDFSHSQSKKRAALAPDLDSNTAQFREAKKLLDEIKTLDVPVVLNLGSDDLRIAEDYTKDVMREIDQGLRDGSRHQFIPYYEQNKLTQNKLFQEHYRFQLDYALPLCYRLGRRLRTPNEVEELTGDGSDESEYMLLYRYIKDAVQNPLPAALGIPSEEVVRSGDRYLDGSYVVDDVDLVFTTNNETQTIKYRHSTGLTPESLPGNHLGKQLQRQGNLGMMGCKLAGLNMTGRGQELTYATASRVGVMTLPGLADPIQSFDTRALHREVPGDMSKRFDATRGRLIRPSLDTVELLDNGNIRHNIVSKKLMEKSETLPRMAVFEVCDMQIGSPTARQDYQIKFLSMILDKAAEMPVAIHIAGDIIHGNLYGNMAYESQSQGLLRTESQKLVVSDIFHKIFDAAPRELRDAVFDVVVQQGNHDEVQRVKSFGGANHDPNIDYLIRDAKDIFETPDSRGKVRHGAVMMTDSGTPVPTWRAYSHYGAMTMMTAHYHINRGMKGNSGGMPVYHPLQRAQGLGSAEIPDMIIGAHWHNEQLAVVGDVVSVIGGAMAERSEFEDMFGYDARVAGTVIEMGGGMPLSVEFVHEKALIDQEVKYGHFTRESLADHGYYDDRDYDAYKHAPYSLMGAPQSALNKSILDLNRAASERIVYQTYPRNPNMFDGSGNPISVNDTTARLAREARRLAL